MLHRHFYKLFVRRLVSLSKKKHVVLYKTFQSMLKEKADERLLLVGN